MAFYMDVSSLLKTFAVEVKVWPKSSGGHYNDLGIWEEDGDGQPLTVYEPFLPSSRIGLYSVMQQLKEIGKIDQYNAVWISSGDYGTGTVCEHAGKRYAVTDIKDLSSYSNAHIYYMADEAKNDGNV